MNKPFLYFERLKNAYDKPVFTEHFGSYLCSLKEADLLDLMLDGNNEFNPSRGGAYILNLNEKNKNSYVTEYIETILAVDKKDIRLLLQEKNSDDSRKFEMLVKNIIADINNIIKAIDKLKWLKHNTIIEKHLTEFILELKSNYLNISASVTDSDFKPLEWKGTVSVLCNIFYDLMKGHTNEKGKVFISTDEEEVAKFIHKAFVEPNGKPLKIDTIKRNLGGKPAKKDRIHVQIRS